MSQICFQKYITTSYEVDLFIKVIMRASKNNIAYRTVKHLVDDFKTKKLDKYNQEHPEERETIPTNIDLDCNSKCSKSTNNTMVSSIKSISSSDTKVVETILVSFPFLKFYFVEKKEEKNLFQER